MRQSVIIPADNRDPAINRLATVLRSLPPGPYRVDIAEHKSTRSNQQNRALWGVIYPAIMAHLPGWESADVHEYCLGECFGWEKVVGLGKTRMRPIRRSSKLNKKEFADYIAFIQRRMAEHGIFVPDPDAEKAA